MISRWNSINFEVGKKILASDYARQLRFPANFGFYILADKLTIVSLTDKEIYLIVV